MFVLIQIFMCIVAYSKVRGCSCFRLVSHDGQFYEDYNPTMLYLNPLMNETFSNFAQEVGLTPDTFTERWSMATHRPPYAYATTEYHGYQCSEARCPAGDNPRTRGVNEIQKIVCIATSGNFTLTFRDNTTMTMNYNVGITYLQHRLQQLYTIRSVNVVYSSGGSVLCTSDGSNAAYIEFLSEYGDLPLLKLTSPHLSPGYTFIITQEVQGTKENLECSQHGICRSDTGACECMQGYVSSADSLPGGKTSVSGGNRGDCGYETRLP